MIPGYRTLAILHESPQTIVERCIRLEDERPCILKVLGPRATRGAESRLRFEHEILTTLKEAGAHNVVRPLTFLERQGQIALVTEDVGGDAVTAFQHGNQLTLLDIVCIARDVAMALVDVHRAQIVHKDIAPKNIIYNPATQVAYLVDFNIASRIANEAQNVANVSGIEGTLRYISPEQTGKMNRSLDYRTDFYSLGVSIFALVMGNPPFVQEDVAQLAHAILTQRVPRLTSTTYDIPNVLADIVEKLMEKMPEDRYQSARALADDLNRCAKALASKGTIEPFDFAANDRPERFEVPPKLYGRNQDLAQLLRTYHQAATGKREVLLVRGPSGVGKSQLVHAVEAAILQHKGIFMAGKYDQLRRHVPFNALTQALGAFVRNVMTQDEESLQSWKRRIQNCVGSIGQALVDIVPVMENLLGPQKQIPALGPQENENRLISLLQRFMRVASQRNPLVLFLDDMQWADGPSLKFLTTLFEDEQATAGLMVILSYRDNEVTGGHPLIATLAKVTKLTSVTTAQVTPLTASDIQTLLADTTGRNRSEVKELANLVLAKTAGNPFFIHTFIKHLHSKNMFTFDATRRTWTWNIDSIGATPVAENVVALVSDRLQTLPASERNLLSIAACLGAEFNLADLAKVSNATAVDTAKQLERALANEIIVPLSAAYRYVRREDDDVAITYKFAHDRVQQAAYELQPADVAMQNHLTIGRRLLEAHNIEAPGEWVHNVVSHYNKARSLLTSQEELLLLARLNLAGAHEAKRSTAYAVGIEYASMGLSCLPKDAWESHYPLTRGLHMELADCQTAAGDLATEAENGLAIMLARSKTMQERVDVQQRRILLAIQNNQMMRALSIGEEELARIGFPINLRKATQFDIIKNFLRTKIALRGKDVGKVWTELPRLTDPVQKARCQILTSLLVAANNVSPEGFVVLILTQVYVTLKYGLHAHSAATVASYVFIATVAEGYTENTRKMSTVSRAIAALDMENGSPGLTAWGHCLTGYVFEQTPEDLFESGIRAWQIGQESGELKPSQWACVIAFNTLSYASLDKCLREAKKYARWFANASEEISYNFTAHVRMWRDLSGDFKAGNDVDNSQLTFEVLDAALKAKGAVTLRRYYYAMQTLGAFIKRDLKAGVVLATNLMNSDALMEFPSIAMPALFFSALTFIHSANVAHAARIPEAKLFKAAVKRMRSVGVIFPQVFGGFATLMDAEEAAWQRKDAVAAELYDKAIEALHTTGYVALWAAALECAGRFYARRAQHIPAGAYMQQAHNAYRGWGALPKCMSLITEFPAYFRVETRMAANVTVTGSSGSTTTDMRNIDLPALLRAGQAVSGEMVPEKVMQRIIASVMECAGATRACLLLMNQGRLTSAIDSGPGNEWPEEIASYVARTQEVVTVADATDATTNKFSKSAYFERAKVRSILCAPVIRQGELMGVLYLENNVTAHVFSENKLMAVQLLSTQAAISLQNSRLYAQMEEAVQERTEELKKAHDQLVRLERETTEVQMAGGFAHEMRNALSAARFGLSFAWKSTPGDGLPSLAELNRERLTQIISIVSAADINAKRDHLKFLLNEVLDTDRQQDELLCHVQHVVDRGMDITDEILKYAQVGTMLPGDDVIDLAALVNKVTDEFSERLHRHRIKCDVKLPATMRTNIREEHAYVIMRNLMENAVDALTLTEMPAEAEKTIQISGEATSNEVRVLVSDTGPGIPEDTKTRIFQPFFSTKGANGVGLGLGLSRKLAELYGGHLTFAPAPAKGAEFNVTLPRRRS